MWWHSVILRTSMQLPWERQRPSTQPPLERWRPHTPLQWGKQKLQGSASLQAMTDPPGNHARSGRWGPQRGKALLPILPVGLWNGSSGLSPWSSRNTHVPCTFTNRKYVAHQSSNSCSTAAYQFKGSHLLTFPLQEAHHLYTSYW